MRSELSSRAMSHGSSTREPLTAKTAPAVIQQTLKGAEPMTVPTPTVESATKMPMIEEKNCGRPRESKLWTR